MPRNDAPQPGCRARALACTFAAAIVAVAKAASASGFAVPRVGDPHGHPALANGYALHFNPGALGGVRGNELLVDVALVYRTVDVDRAPSALSPSSPPLLHDPAYVASNTGPSHAGNLIAAPFLAAVSDLGGGNLFAGLGVYVPYGGAVRFDKRDAFAGNDVRGAVDGSQRWSIVSAEQLSVYTTGVLGVRVPQTGLSFGVGTSVVVTRIRGTQARNASGADDTATEGRALLDVSGTHLALSAGVYWRLLPDDAVRIGISYALRPGLGEMRLDGTLRQYYGASDTKREVTLRQSYPDVIRFGIAARVSRAFELRYDADYTTWSLVDQQCVVTRDAPCLVKADGSEDRVGAGQIVLALRRRWRDTGSMRLGVGYFADARSELYASAGYETSAVPAATLDAAYPDAFKWIGSLGVRRRIGEPLTIGASATWLAYLPTTATGQQQAALAGASRGPNADGTYRSRVLFFNASATFAF